MNQEDKELDKFLSRYKRKEEQEINLKKAAKSKQAGSHHQFEQRYIQVRDQVIVPVMDRIIKRVKEHEGIELTSVTSIIHLALSYQGSLQAEHPAYFQLDFQPDKEEQKVLVKVSFHNNPHKNIYEVYEVEDIITAEGLERIVLGAFQTAQQTLQEEK